MMDYLDSTTSYEKKDVTKCMKIVDFYLMEIDNVRTKQEAYEVIRKTVEMLNLLNNACFYELIETSQRDDLAGLINLAAKEKGYNKENKDLTEKYREW